MSSFVSVAKARSPCRFQSSSAPNPTCKPLPKPAQALTDKMEGNEQISLFNYSRDTYVFILFYMQQRKHLDNTSSIRKKKYGQKLSFLFFLFPGETTSELKSCITSSAIWTVFMSFMTSMLLTSFAFLTAL